MNPYYYVQEATKNGESLLSMCCGIGFELVHSRSKDITGVDISEIYIAELRKRMPHVKTVVSNAVDYLVSQPDASVDVISCIDGLEHMTKEDAMKFLVEAKRVARKTVLVFTQDRFIRNEPHDAWGISGSDVTQHHLSENTVEEVTAIGYALINRESNISQHGDPYDEVMYEWRRV
jgi:ubiquinone/menaquinone biosynthesis C-methylase UbiE